MNHLLHRCALGVGLIAVAVPLCQNGLLVAGRLQGPSLSVSGDVTGLEPGVPGRLVVTVSNRGDAAATVHRLVTEVRTAVPGCALAIAPWTGVMAVAPGESASRSLPVTVSGRRCAGASWDLTYSASG